MNLVNQNMSLASFELALCVISAVQVCFLCIFQNKPLLFSNYLSLKQMLQLQKIAGFLGFSLTQHNIRGKPVSHFYVSAILASFANCTLPISDSCREGHLGQSLMGPAY